MVSDCLPDVVRAADERAVRPPAATTLGEVLSPTQVNTFLSCPAKYFFRYGAGLPDPASGALVRGKAVHSVIAYAMTAKMEGYALDPGAAAEIIEPAWDAAAEGAEFQAYEDVEQLKRSGAVLAEKWLAEAGPFVQPAAVELPVMGVIGGVPVRGIVDVLDTSGRVIDLKTATRKPSAITPDQALQLATYAAITPGASGEARIDALISTKEPQLVQIEHTPGAAGKRLVERLYPLVVEGIAAGVYPPSRSSTRCSRRYCNFWRECTAEYGGEVAE
jgi:CRISPR/Cas system-associated exonuclease Cas4 (RecB family)